MNGARGGRDLGDLGYDYLQSNHTLGLNRKIMCCWAFMV